MAPHCHEGKARLVLVNQGLFIKANSNDVAWLDSLKYKNLCLWICWGTGVQPQRIASRLSLNLRKQCLKRVRCHSIINTDSCDTCFGCILGTKSASLLPENTWSIYDHGPFRTRRIHSAGIEHLVIWKANGQATGIQTRIETHLVG